MYKQVWCGSMALLSMALILAGCGTGGTELPTTQAFPTAESPVAQPSEQNGIETPEYVWSQLLSRDAILPIYDPEFVPAAQADYTDDELVMGVAINGEAKAYPISPLNSREMVNDVLGGTPILVTW